MPLLIDAHHIGAHQTGNETWIRNIARELVTLAAPGELVFAAADPGVEEVRRLTEREPERVGGSAVRRLAVDLPRICRRVNAGAVLVQYTMPLGATPAVVMIHDTSFEDAAATTWMRSRTARRIRWAARRSARRAAHLLVPSEFTKSCLVGAYGVAADEVTVTPNAVDPELAAALDRTPSSRLDGDTFRVLAVGNVLPRKNLLTLAAAVAAMRAEHIGATLRVVGSVAAGARPLEAEIRKLLGPAVSFTGYIDNDELAMEYKTADVLGFPSLFEGFGIPALEAMYAGTPVVVSDSTSLPEVVGEAGVVVPTRDEAAWFTALRRIHDEPRWRDDLAAAGRRRAASFSWRTSAEAVLGSLRRATSARAR